MRKNIIIMTFAATALMSLVALEMASAYWIWTPETKKFVNPKYAVKDSPKEQFDWAMNFYQAKDYQKAAQEFEKLTKQYEYSEYASKAQYYAGLCYENMNKLYIAFQNYQKAIENFPHIENMDEIIAREFNIANIFEAKASPKVLGTDIMTSTDRAVEIYKKVVDNAPFGKLADEAQFRMGQALKKSERYDEAIPAFQKILDDYPNSQFIDKAKFEVADCAYKASLKPAYDIESTDKAIKAFEDFSQANKDEKLSGEADKTIQRLKDKAAEKSLITAQFYESQKHYESAIIYYRDIVARFPDSSLAVKAKAKIEELDKRVNKSGQGAGQEGEKKSWQFFKFAKPLKKEKSEETPVSKPEKPKGWWNPLKFTGKPKPSEPAAVVKEEAESQAPETEPVKETPVQAEAMPIKTETVEAKPVEEKAASPETVATQKTVTTQEMAVPAAETKAESVKAETPKKGWTPFKFAKPAKKEKSEETPVPKPEKPKGWWNPLKFTGKPKEEKAAQPTDSSAKEKNIWAPLSFTKKPKPSESAAVKKETKTPRKGWTPFKFAKPLKKKKSEETPVPKPEKPKGWWNPLKFTNKPKEASENKEAPIQTEEPDAKEKAPADKIE